MRHVVKARISATVMTRRRVSMPTQAKTKIPYLRLELRTFGLLILKHKTDAITNLANMVRVRS